MISECLKVIKFHLNLNFISLLLDTFFVHFKLNIKQFLWFFSIRLIVTLSKLFSMLPNLNPLKILFNNSLNSNCFWVTDLHFYWQISVAGKQFQLPVA